MKFTRVRSLHPRDCPPELYKQFRSLCFRDSGHMLYALPKSKNEKNARIHYILDEDDKVAAWAITSNYWEPHLTYFYTRAKYRSMGLGTRVLRAAQRYTSTKLKKKMKYMPHDERSIGFFDACKRKKVLRGRPT